MWPAINSNILLQLDEIVVLNDNDINDKTDIDDKNCCAMMIMKSAETQTEIIEYSLENSNDDICDHSNVVVEHDDVDANSAAIDDNDVEDDDEANIDEYITIEGKRAVVNRCCCNANTNNNTNCKVHCDDSIIITEECPEVIL